MHSLLKVTHKLTGKSHWAGTWVSSETCTRSAFWHQEMTPHHKGQSDCCPTSWSKILTWANLLLFLMEIKLGAPNMLDKGFKTVLQAGNIILVQIYLILSSIMVSIFLLIFSP